MGRDCKFGRNVCTRSFSLGQEKNDIRVRKLYIYIFMIYIYIKMRKILYEKIRNSYDMIIV